MKINPESFEHERLLNIINVLRKPAGDDFDLN